MAVPVANRDEVQGGGSWEDGRTYVVAVIFHDFAHPGSSLARIPQLVGRNYIYLINTMESSRDDTRPRWNYFNPA